MERALYLAKVRVSPALLPYLASEYGGQSGLLMQASSPDAEGWITLDLPFESLAVARTRLLGLGRAVEVLEPEALRLSVLDFAGQIIQRYRSSGE
jgi:predicted DNA-binding transcriptional regulator YafY